jgi:hypothetical protein
MAADVHRPTTLDGILVAGPSGTIPPRSPTDLPLRFSSQSTGSPNEGPRRLSGVSLASPRPNPITRPPRIAAMRGQSRQVLMPKRCLSPDDRCRRGKTYRWNEHKITWTGELHGDVEGSICRRGDSDRCSPDFVLVEKPGPLFASAMPVSIPDRSFDLCQRG